MRTQRIVTSSRIKRCGTDPRRGAGHGALAQSAGAVIVARVGGRAGATLFTVQGG